MPKTQSTNASRPSHSLDYIFASLTAFASGACLMVMELVASRVLAPVFGNTVFLWTSVIGLILAALTLGYAVGGVIADRWPRLTSLSWMLTLSGIFVSLVPLLSPPVLAWLGEDAGVISGPVFATAILFLIPGILIGAISPIAVKLVSLGGADVGHASGRVSALGALGSILGTFAGGFFLIPIAGNRALLVGIACTLAAVGLMGFLMAKTRKGLPAAALLITGGLSVLGLQEQALPPGMLFDHQTFYHRVRVRDLQWGSRMARMLTLDTTHEGAMFLDGDGLPFEYTRYIDVADLFLDKPTSAAFVGGGSFAMPKRFIQRHAGSSATAFELDPVVVEVGKRYFETDKFPQLTMRTGDARQNLRTSTESFDLIFGDAYNGISSIPIHLTTREYYELVRSRLKPGGVYMSNIISALEGPRSELFYATMRTLGEVFPEVYVFGLGNSRLEAQNVILVAPVTPRRMAVADIRSKGYTAGMGVLTDTVVDHAPLSEGIRAAMILTDDHNPVEIMVARH